MLRSATFAALTTLLVPAAPATDLVHRPESGSRWGTVFELERRTEGGALEVRMGGQPVPTAYLPRLELEDVETLSARTIETVERGADGAVSFLRRVEDASFDSRGAFRTNGVDSQTWSDPAESELIGRTLRFTLGDDGVAVEVADDGDAIAGLERLAAHQAPVHLVPDDAVEVGATWTVEGAVLGQFFDPLGDLRFGTKRDRYQHEAVYAGELECTLKSVAEESRLATVRLEGRIERSWVETTDLEHVPMTTGEADETTTLAYEVAGRLVWDLGLNRYVELELEGDGALTVHTVRDPELEGPAYESKFTAESSYSLRMLADPESGELPPPTDD